MRDWDSRSDSLSELIEHDSVVTISIKSSNDSNNFSISGNETVESEEGLDVSVVKGVVS